MQVVIGCLNAKYIHRSSAPWCLAAGIDAFAKSDIQYHIVEGTINGDAEQIVRSVLTHQPQVVSFSCYIWNITATLSICEKIKKERDWTIVLGGPEVAYRAADVLKQYDFIDYVLSGEGEFCFPPFLDMLCGNGSKDSVAGLCYREAGKTRQNAEESYTETPPSPYSDAYFESLGGRICYIESSRGCPYRCAFCLSGRVGKLRFFDMEQVQRDLLKLANSGTQTVKFVDRTFNANERHANEILSFILQNYGDAIPRGVCFHFEMAGDIVKESTLQLLSQMPTGAVQLEIGMQSFNEETLCRIHRKTDTKKLIQNIKKLLSFQNMHIHIDLIAGLTGEEMQSFGESFNTGYALGAHMLQMGFLKLLHGADMRENPSEFPCEFTDEPPYEVTATPWLTKREILRLKRCEDALDRMYNSGRFLFTLDYLIKDIGFTPFDLFCKVGDRVNGNGKSLGEYALLLYQALAEECDKDILREKMVCDLLCCSSALQIPKEIKISDPRHKKVKMKLAKSGNIKVAILPKDGRIFAVNHAGKRDFFGRFPYEYYDINLLD